MISEKIRKILEEIEAEEEREKKGYLKPSPYYIEKKEKAIPKDELDSCGYSCVPLKLQKEYREEGKVSDEGIYHVDLLVKVIPEDTIPYSAHELVDELENGYLKNVETIFADAEPADEEDIASFKDFLEERCR
jgi:hypothetical protein